MASDKVKLYLEVITKYCGLVEGISTKEEEEKLLDDSDNLWYSMSDEEQSKAERLIIESRTSNIGAPRDLGAPKDLGMVDMAVEIGQSIFPRKKI